MTDSDAVRLRVKLDEQPVSNMFDKAILQTLRDASNGNDGPLRILEKPAFDKKRISRPDIRHTVILSMMYLKP